MPMPQQGRTDGVCLAGIGAVTEEAAIPGLALEVIGAAHLIDPDGPAARAMGLGRAFGREGGDWQLRWRALARSKGEQQGGDNESGAHDIPILPFLPANYKA